MVYLDIYQPIVAKIEDLNDLLHFTGQNQN